MVTGSAVISMIIMLSVAFSVWQGTSQGLDKGDKSLFYRNLLLLGALIVILQVVENRTFLSTSSIWIWMLLLLYMLIPVIYFKSNRYSANMDIDFPYSVINSRHEVVSAVYMAIFCFCIQYLCAWGGNKQYLCMTVLMACLSFLPLIDVGHYLKYGEGLSEASIVSIQQTNFGEAREYIYAVLKKKGLAAVALAVAMALYLCNCYFLIWPVEATFEGSVIIGILGIFSGAAFYKELRRCKILTAWASVSELKASEKMYKTGHAERYANIGIDAGKSLPSKLPGTVIMVIGESASRDYMHLYNNTLRYDNTPWLESKRRDKGFFILENAYASYNLTMEVLKLALTEASQYNDKEFAQAVSVLDIARKSGYRTYWFSGQGMLGQDNLPSTMIASTADEYRGAINVRTSSYDKELLDLVKEVEGGKNNFIVLHLMGSHAYYNARYPSEWKKWSDGSIEADYANTILYTDEVLHELFDYAKDNLNLQCMMYFSDHGENLEKGHHPSIRTPDTLRIPMFVYLSEKYCEVYGTRAGILERNKNRFYSNDMVYNTMLGLLNVHTDHYDCREDLSSEEYAYDKDTVLTFLGQEHASDY